jgi:hypothetical protein
MYLSTANNNRLRLHRHALGVAGYQQIADVNRSFGGIHSHLDLTVVTARSFPLPGTPGWMLGCAEMTRFVPRASNYRITKVDLLPGLDVRFDTGRRPNKLPPRGVSPGMYVGKPQPYCPSSTAP